MKHSHNIDDDSTARGDQHDVSINLIVVTYDPFNGQVDQSSSDDPDGHDGDKCPEDLWKKKKIMNLYYFIVVMQFITDNKEAHLLYAADHILLKLNCFFWA